MTARDLLHQLDPWFAARCRCAAARLPGLHPDEVYQRAVEEFLVKLERWLQQDPTVDVVAQAKTLLTYCIRHVETQEIRERRRRHEVPDPDATDAFDHLAPPVEPTDDDAAGELLRQVRDCTTPPCALCLLSLRLPAVVERGDAERAKAWTTGGSKAVPRLLDDAWRLYTDGRERPGLVADDVAWKNHVGIAWYTAGPPEAVPETVRASAASKVERYANRGAEDLRQALLGRKEET